MEKKYFVRGANSGIYYGEIVKRDGCETEMKDARYVKMLRSVDTLYRIATVGYSESDSDTQVDPIFMTNTPFRTVITDTCEILCISDKGVEDIEKKMPWER